MIFVDTWAWIGMADDTDQYHAAVIEQHRSEAGPLSVLLRGGNSPAASLLKCLSA